jgi:hypothetical protein
MLKECEIWHRVIKAHELGLENFDLKNKTGGK